jgi:hypothetical protein
MKWSWKIGRIAGIDIQLHATFLLLIAWVAISELIHTRSWSESVAAALFTATPERPGIFHVPVDVRDQRASALFPVFSVFPGI